MRHLILSFLFLISFHSFSQTTFYTSDGKNRFTQEEVNELLSETVTKMKNILKKEIFGSIKITQTETINDSIISKFSLEISDKKHDKIINSGPLSDYINKPFINFELKNLSGTIINSKTLIGKPTMINFWFTKCAPCIDEMPALNKIKEKYKNDFNFISITFEQKENVEKFLKKHDFEFLHLIDAENFINLLGIKSYPLNLFLDKNGVLKNVEGGIPYEKKEGDKLKIGQGKEIIEIIEKLK